VFYDPIVEGRLIAAASKPADDVTPTARSRDAGGSSRGTPEPPAPEPLPSCEPPRPAVTAAVATHTEQHSNADGYVIVGAAKRAKAAANGAVAKAAAAGGQTAVAAAAGAGAPPAAYRRPSKLRRSVAMYATFAASGLAHELMFVYFARPYKFGMCFYFLVQVCCCSAGGCRLKSGAPTGSGTEAHERGQTNTRRIFHRSWLLTTPQAHTLILTTTPTTPTTPTPTP